ncbi:MAG: dihydrofolate reductase family protein [Verrucomicrobiota bacterium]
MKTKTGLPFVYLNIATTADGKIAPSNRQFEPFSSPRDHDLLLKLRAGADAVMSGARTVDSVPVNLGPGSAKFRRLRVKNGLSEYNLRIIASGAGSVSPEAEIFKHHFSPIIILVTERAPKRRVERLRKLGAEVAVFGKHELDFRKALLWLRARWGVNRLLCEGGGEINAALLRSGLVNEVFQTLCPVIFGGRFAPTLADGAGIEKLDAAIGLKLKSMKRHGDELYLVWEVTSRYRRGRAHCCEVFV